ncbi:MAG: response regulator [Bacteroidales bacterium]|nr:response regulator [Bacteroidales bacterium]
MNYAWENYTTLVAEDDPLNFRFVELMLKRRTGINIIWAKDGLSAVNICKEKNNVDIVLMDLQLPDLDGIQSLKLIKQFNPYLPIIVQTANSWNNEEEACIESGCDGFFNKPLNFDELLSHMDLCLKSYSQIRHSKINT